jgi:L-histidine N-alpha-methyltransferase
MSSAPATVRRDLYEATLVSLQSRPKQLPPVWLYDERGSRLYEEIQRLPQYYLPQREAQILRAQAPELARRTRARTLVELGSGNARNTRFLLDALAASGTLECFVPVDVSEEMLHATADSIATAYPGIAVDEIVGDFERDLTALPKEGPRLVALLGSTIGNLYPEQRSELLRTLAVELRRDDSLLLGLDLVKDARRLMAAYDDALGVTEAFVRNAVDAVNGRLGATFDQHRFVYDARWDPQHEWMDIALRAREPHTVSVERIELDVVFARDERLRVEISSKFRRGSFQPELERAGFRVEAWWTDPGDEYAAVLARPQS